MADFYTEMAAVSSSLLSPTSEGGLGQGVVKLTRLTQGGVNPDNPWETVPGEEKTETLKAAVSGIKSELVGTDVGDTVLLSSDRQVICSPPEMDYIAGDVLSIDGRPVNIISVQNIPAAGIRSAVRFIVRG